MPLPSQSARSSVGARSYGRRKGFSPKLIVGGLIVGAAVVAWLVLPSGDKGNLAGPKQASATPAPVTPPAAEKPAPKQPIESNSAPAAPIAPLVEINQGRGGTVPVKAPETAPSVAPVSPPPATPSVTPQAKIEAPPNTLDQVPSLAAARSKQAEGDLTTARVLFSRVLADGKLNAADEAAVRGELEKINDDMVFSPRVVQGDPYSMVYKVQSGDSLVKISQKHKLGPDWRFIQRVNRMSNPNNVSLGQSLKLVKGPFHAVVRKSLYRLDVYMGPGDDESSWVFVRSFAVGLGEGNSTPTGTFIVKKGSKLVDPPWVNPRTGEQFASRDPKNPIGAYWVGLEGLGDAVTQSGYGIHGTIDPDSIGKQRSMGCVRLGNADIKLMFELLGEQVSMVRIEP